MSFKTIQWNFQSMNGDLIIFEKDFKDNQFKIFILDEPDNFILFEINDVPMLKDLLTKISEEY